MENNYYIKLIGEKIKKKWHYSDLENRNNVYEDLRNRFGKERTGQIPFIEVDVGNEDHSGPSVTFPLRLNPEMKDEVIKHIDSLS